MKVAVLYDSEHGNTARIAEVIASALRPDAHVQLARVKDLTHDDLAGLDALVVGSPTQAWRPTGATRTFLRSLPPHLLRGLPAAAFDTGLHSRFSGSASHSIERMLRHKGCTIAVPATRFYVRGTEGPLDKGELFKAMMWARSIAHCLTANRAA